MSDSPSATGVTVQSVLGTVSDRSLQLPEEAHHDNETIDIFKRK